MFSEDLGSSIKTNELILSTSPISLCVHEIDSDTVNAMQVYKYALHF